LAINPPSDIILDVARAADPFQYTAAVERLSRIGEAGEADTSFDVLLGSIDADVGASVEKPLDLSRADLRSRLQPISAEGLASASSGPYRQFEAFVLQTFIQSMFPKDASHVFGDGIAGSYWSSMLAEQVANQVANAGGIGIADEIAAAHPGAIGARDVSANRVLFDGRPGGVIRAGES
jgi:flagellar protein FlgJ